MRGGTTKTTRTILLAVAGLSVAVGATGCKTGSKGAKAKSTSVFEVFAPETPQQAAAWAVDPYDADNRQRGILLLANAPFGGEPVYVDLYHAALADGDAGVRTAAVRALGLHGRPEQATDLLPMLADEDRILRWETAVALQRLHNREVIDSLIERLDPVREEDAEVRAAAAVALGQYAEPRVLDALIASLDDADLGVNRATERSLVTLTGQELGPEAGPWLAWSRDTDDVFADRGVYEYPVFQRDRRFVEWIVPWLDPPNEVAAAPAGYDPPAPGYEPPPAN